jgi:hypothetical protein
MSRNSSPSTTPNNSATTIITTNTTTNLQAAHQNLTNSEILTRSRSKGKQKTKLTFVWHSLDRNMELNRQ